ncbi:MAG TPA: hypothetical protein VIE69_09295 [Methylophilaceae bacterium]
MKSFFITILCLITLSAHARDEFAAESSIKNLEPIPAPIISHLSAEIDLDKHGCKEKRLADTLEGKEISLNSHVRTFLLKPKAMCLCGVYYCPVWIYKFKNNSAERLWFTAGTGEVEILDNRSHGYRQIKESGGTAGHSYERNWAWDGNKYTVVNDLSQKP